LSWLVGAVVGGALAAAVAYPTGYNRGKAIYASRLETLRQKLLEKLPTTPTPEWVNVPEVVSWMRTAPAEDVLKWAIQALNAVIDKWETQSQFITTLMESLKQAFQVPPATTAAPPRIARKLETAKAVEIPAPAPKPAGTPPVLI
jgi:hypothetical protein